MLPAWTLPLIVVAIAVPIVAGFALGGPALGLAIGALVTVGLIVLVARAKPGGRIETATAGDERRRILLVTTQDLDDPQTTERIAEHANLGNGGPAADVLILAPAKSGFLARWASDERAAKAEAQRRLVLGAASLGKADIDVRATVGDENVVLAVEDQLATFPATEVILVTGPESSDPAGQRAATELSARLRQPLTRLTVA